MTRAISPAYRASLQALATGDVDLIFLKIAHAALEEDIRVVADPVDFVFEGETYVGFPFDITLLSDADEVPRTKLSVQNVDRRIGDALQAISSPARLTLTLCCSADFDLTQRPRVPLGAVSIEYQARGLYLTNVSLDALTVTGDVVGLDFGQRVWPYRRATKTALPGLYR